MMLLQGHPTRNVFFDFNIEIKVIDVKLGPVITLYEILPAAGIKINTIINLADDISQQNNLAEKMPEKRDEMMASFISIVGDAYKQTSRLKFD